jgi:hypothetical protein
LEGQEVCWGYNYEYLPDINSWKTPIYGTYSLLKLLIVNGKIEYVMYGFNDKNSCNEYKKNLKEYGYIMYKSEPNIESNSIDTYYENGYYALIGISEYASKGSMPYVITWVLTNNLF